MNRITLTALFAMAAPAAMAAPTEYPLTIDNCGHTLTFSARPDNVVSIGQATTEILYALGQADRLAGTALWFNAVLPDYEDENERVERISDNMPSFEAVVAKRPGFVPTMFEWMIGEQGAVGTREQFADLGIPAYVMPADCESKDNLVGADGTRLAPFDIREVGEHQLGDRNRCDLTATRMIGGRARMLVIEGKGQWHRDLFTAAELQLSERYSMHPDADEQGIFLVIWYGSEKEVAGRKQHGYGSAADLREAIEDRLPDGLRGRIDVFVLDVARP